MTVFFKFTKVFFQIHDSSLLIHESSLQIHPSSLQIHPNPRLTHISFLTKLSLFRVRNDRLLLLREEVVHPTSARTWGAYVTVKNNDYVIHAWLLGTSNFFGDKCVEASMLYECTGFAFAFRLPKLVQTIAPSVPFPMFKSEGEPGTGRSNWIV